MNDRDPSSTLWAVTSYFNPAGYQSRLRNYRVFRRHLPMPLLAVELSFDGHFALQPEDADLLVRFRVGEVLWQKERLLNAAWSRLPAHCTQVAWVDCDVVLTHPRWVAQARAGLLRHKLLHGFTTLRHLPPGAAVDGTGPAHTAGLPEQMSVVHRMHRQGSATEVFSGVLTRAHGAPTPGIAWVAWRDWLRHVRLFDACVVGGGDTAFAAAVLGVPQQAVALHAMGPRQREHYLQWADTTGLVSGRDVGCLPGEVLHLWHGSMADRRSRERHARLAHTGFDPRRDLVADADAPWRWADPAAAAARYVGAYFQDRNEDAVA